MPTFIAQFADAEIKVRFKEPLLTAGLDQMLTGITPQGIHRGFRLATNVAALTVTVQADPADSDHIAAYTTADGYTLRLRRTGGDFSLDLTPFASTTVVIAIFAEYASGVTTFAEIRAYELDPVDEFTIAAERDELVVLGVVAVPAAGVIAESDIAPTYRSLAWDHVGSDAAEWEQIVENGSFELAADDAAFLAADRGFVPHWATQYIPVQHVWEVTSTNPHTGQYALKMTGTGAASISVIPIDRVVAVQPGQLIRVSFWVRGENWPVTGAGGTMGVQLNFYGHQLSLLAFRVAQDKSLSGTFGWTRVDSYLEVPFTPANIEWCVPAITIVDSPVAGVTASLVFDDVRIWVEKGPPTIPYASVCDGLTNGGKVVGQLGIAETNVLQFGITQNLDTFVQGILFLHKFDNVSPGVNRYRWKRLDDEPFLLRLVEGALRLEGIVGSDVEAEFARLGMEIANPLVSPITNMEELFSNTNAAVVRRYAGSAFSSAHVLDIINGKWDDGLSEFNLDDPTQDATELILANIGGGYLALNGWDFNDGTPYPLHTPLAEFIGDITRPDVELRLRDGFITFDQASPGPAASPFNVGSNREDPGGVNVLCAANVVKAWAWFRVGNGTAFLFESYGIDSITYDDFSPMLTFFETMENNQYAVVINHEGTLSYTASPDVKTTTTFTIDSLQHVTGGGHAQVNFSDATQHYFSVIVIGRQV